MGKTRRKCEYKECNINPSFDIQGGKGRFCKTHKTSEMTDVITKRCEHKGCRSLNPVFNTLGEKGKFCNIHKTPVMINVKNKCCEFIGS